MPVSAEADQTPEWVKGDLPESEARTGAEARPVESTPEPGPEAAGDAGPGQASAATTSGPADEESVQAAPADDRGESGPAAPEAAAAEMDSVSDEGERPAGEPAGDPERLAGVAAQTGEAAQADGEARSSNGGEPAPARARRRSRKARPALNGTRDGASPEAEQRAAGEPAPVDLGGLSPEAVLESLLFVAEGPVPLAHLAEALSVHARDVEDALNVLAATYHQRGLSLQRFRDRVQLTTAPAAAAAVERFLGLAATTPLSRAALETLSIIAYQQPVTRPQIEAVRGVNSDSVIKNLLTKGLVEEMGRAEGPGRPVLYSTTPEFLQHFGLASLGDLPPLALPGTTVDTLPAASHDEVLKG